MNNAIELDCVYKMFPVEGESRKFFPALDNISLVIEQGSLTVIGGANGSGKSVLMNIIAGLLPPSKGNIKLASKPGLIFQDAAVQILGDTPREDVAVGPKNLKIKKNEIPLIVEQSLSAVSLFHKVDFPSEFLSGGEKRRLAVASILAMNRNIMIFDEPYANLDYPGVLDVNALIKGLKKKGTTVIILTHELEKCLGLADHFVVLHKGRKVFDGTPAAGLEQKLEEWGIRNPLNKYSVLEDLVW